MVRTIGSRYKPKGWVGESQRHYLAAKGVTTKRPRVTKEQFKRKSVAAFKQQFKVNELIIPSEKNEQMVADALYTGILLRRQKKEQKESERRAAEMRKRKA